MNELLSKYPFMIQKNVHIKLKESTEMWFANIVVLIISTFSSNFFILITILIKFDYNPIESVLSKQEKSPHFFSYEKSAAQSDEWDENRREKRPGNGFKGLCVKKIPSKPGLSIVATKN